jgi:hypothetical protein
MRAASRRLALPLLAALALAGACSAPRPVPASVPAVATSRVPPELLLGATPAPTATARTFAPAAPPGAAPTPSAAATPPPAQPSATAEAVQGTPSPAASPARPTPPTTPTPSPAPSQSATAVPSPTR